MQNKCKTVPQQEARSSYTSIIPLIKFECENCGQFFFTLKCICMIVIMKKKVGKKKKTSYEI